MAVLTARKASVLFANHDPMRPYMDTVLALANSVGGCGAEMGEKQTWLVTVLFANQDNMRPYMDTV